MLAASSSDGSATGPLPGEGTSQCRALPSARLTQSLARLVTVGRVGADKQCMSLQESAEHVADDKDFGLAGHLAAIDRMHREALAQLDALVQPWAHLWLSRSEATPSEPKEQPVTGQPPVYGAHATAA
jgi:hypothetical protein